MNFNHESKVQMIPIDKITVLNKRARGRSKFKQIVTNIANLGLKKPVIVARRPGKDGEVRYALGCGQGRLEAFIALGQTEIPALVVEADDETLLLMSLAENLARRNRTTLEMAREIAAMKERGHTNAEIAKKVDLNVTYVNAIVRLIRHGEERLIIAVERHGLPMSVAVAIAESGDQEVQQAMLDAYNRGDLQGKALLKARRLVEQRRARGKSSRSSPQRREPVTAETLLQAHRNETVRQQVLVNRFRVSETRLSFIISAMKKLLSDESFVNLLRAEKLTTMPQYLADRIQIPGVNHGT